MGTEKIPSLMIRMAIPSVIAQVINILYNIVDRIYIGHISGVGAAALTGVGLTFPIITLISAFSAFVGSGGAPLASIWMGKNDKKHAEKILGTGVFMLLCFSLILMAVFLIFQRPLLYAFGASDATIGYAMEYLTIYLIGTVFVEIALGLNPFIIAQGRSTTAMMSIVIGAVINIVLDPIFIFVFHMGVKGAAIATVISQAVSAAWNVKALVDKKAVLKIVPSCIRPDIRVIGQIFSLGISPFIMRSTESLISIVLNHQLQKFGGDLYVGSLTIMQSVMQLFSAPLSGYTQGVQPIVSYNFGAGKFDRVRTTYRYMIFGSFLISFVTAASAMIFPEFYAMMFTNEGDLIALTGKVMPVFMAGMLIFGLQNGIQPTFLGLGQAKISLFIALLRKVILLVPLALIFPNFFGVMGVYYAEPVADITSAVIASILFLCNIKKILTMENLKKIK
ncbi:MAG TPA: MATE family efflux transporter [Candidatus Blautia stercorigallinarum]|uniref:Multidrug export protein MepA n=1 Tax=Candidatus Blautia stercorigallinarum TaxID=2838501 RepID=A0A9D1PBF7_9FIRM|nr:MATE family efflux transporter [Candidatus Blautia stercorigallinarum]